MLPTRFCELVGCRLPIQQAGMGGVATPQLAGAVAAAGGLGMLPLLGAAPFDQRLHEAEALAAGGPVGVNVLLPFASEAEIEAAGHLAPLVELFWGWPDGATVARAADGGARVAWQVGSPDEARAAVDAGCDLVVAQGVEAGGHVRGEIALLPLLVGVLDAVDVPVVAAGGIGGPRSAAAAFAAGADAVRLGTRFVATVEGGAHPAYVDALCAAGPGDTVLTTVFGLGWPDAPHRVLRSAADAVTDLVAAAADTGAWTAHAGRHRPVSAGSVSPPTTDVHGEVHALALYAGQSVVEVTGVATAAEVVRSVIEGAAALLDRRR